MPNWELFDGVYVLGFTGYADRMDGMTSELKRVGLYGKAEIVWNYPTPFDDLISRSVDLRTDMRYVSPTMGHYRILKTAMELGKRRILVLEDDARFMKDTEDLAESIRFMPIDSDISLLDHQPTGVREETPVNGWWSECRDKRVSAAAYSLSRRGLEWIVGLYDGSACRRNAFRCCDQMFSPALFPQWLSFFVATPHAAIQKPFSENNSGNDMRRIYEKTGIDTREYGDG